MVQIGAHVVTYSRAHEKYIFMLVLEGHNNESQNYISTLCGFTLSYEKNIHKVYVKSKYLRLSFVLTKYNSISKRCMKTCRQHGTNHFLTKGGGVAPLPIENE